MTRVEYLTDAVTFHEDDHIYLDIEGKAVPSVTSILKHGDVDGLMEWASRISVEAYGRALRGRFSGRQQKEYGLRVMDIKEDAKIYGKEYIHARDAAAYIGTQVHDSLFTPVDEDAPREVKNAIKAWHQCLSDLGDMRGDSQ